MNTNFTWQGIGSYTRDSEPASDFESRWCIQQEWGSQLPLAFNAVHTDDRFLIPLASKDDFPVEPAKLAWWALPPIFLRLALGWNDPFAGIATWRNSGLETSHPALGLIARSYGFTVGVSLSGSSPSDFEALREHVEASKSVLAEALPELQFGLRARKVPGGFDSLVSGVTPGDGGGDPAHLSFHIREFSRQIDDGPIAVGQWVAPNRSEWKPETHRVVIRSIRNLIEDLGSAFSIDPNMFADVFLAGFGYLGTFSCGSVDGHFFMVGHEYSNGRKVPQDTRYQIGLEASSIGFNPSLVRTIDDL